MSLGRSNLHENICMKNISHYLFVLLPLFIGSNAFAADPLPDRLELEYAFIYSKMKIKVGEVTRKLYRQENGNYIHTTWMRTTGFAKILMNTEWHEEGEFSVKGQEVIPLRFSTKRNDGKRQYDDLIEFDWRKSRIMFSAHDSHPLQLGAKDLDSVLYMLMLQPLVQGGEKIIPVIDDKKVDLYHFRYQKNESLQTPFGRHNTIVIRRVSQRRLERERQCYAKNLNLREVDCTQPDDFTIWLLPAKHYIPVKLERRRKNETTTLVLRGVRGL